MTAPSLGVCYYPEHWPEAQWADDATRMVALGLTHVRIGEFAWSLLEPTDRKYDFDWLERAIDTLHRAGLKVVLGTPTATPPKWLVDKMPDMLPVDAEGRVRGFGSRRHVCLAHTGYRRECARIVTALASRFGHHPGVVAWQTDNEYGCHDTTISYSEAALDEFREWLAERYETIAALNEAWGNRFWSMAYESFDEIELPTLTVTEVNPAHRMAFRRFASDQTVAFNRLQVEIIRRLSPGRDVLHNYMGQVTDFDHFAVSRDLDIATWDAYPLGFLEDRIEADNDWKRRFSRAGDPDFQAFHHDLYRAMCGGRWWVMEQQPGPVNWAPYNPAPRDGMVRLWALEAMAHGAEVVSYFRWRQAPFAQEQMHSGLLRPDGSEAEAYDEAATVQRDIARIDWQATERADVALIFDYASCWAWEVQPQGKDFLYFKLVFEMYRGLRRLGLNVDFVSPDAPDLEGRKLVLIPGLFAWTDALKDALSSFEGQVLIGPRTGSKTNEFRIPDGLPPALPENLLDLKVLRVESLRPDTPIPVKGGGMFKGWREFTEGGEIEIRCEDGEPALSTRGALSYLAGWPDDELLRRILARMTDAVQLTTMDLPEGLRTRWRGKTLFVFNYDEKIHDLSQLGLEGQLEPSGVSVFSI